MGTSWSEIITDYAMVVIGDTRDARGSCNEPGTFLPEDGRVDADVDSDVKVSTGASGLSDARTDTARVFGLFLAEHAGKHGDGNER